jgi:RHS repeat-associated protein
VRARGSPDGYSRVIELEAWGPTVGSGGSGQANLSWLVADHLGTPRMIFDKTGSLANVSRHDYLPFGEELLAGQGLRTSGANGLGYSGDNVRQKFTSKERDIETGLDYFNARYYASTQGRFTSVDPYDINLERQYASSAREGNEMALEYLSNPQHWNRYAYVLNNPLKYIDPDGFAEKLTVNLNIVYDKRQFTEEEAKKAAAAQVADLKKVYGPLDIDFSVSYTAGTANSAKTQITEGLQAGGINVFLSKSRNEEGVTRGNGQIFISLASNQKSDSGLLSHEVAHKLGMTYTTGISIGGVDLGNVYSDFHINTSNAKLRRGGAKEGVNWWDDYRKAPPTVSSVRICRDLIVSKHPRNPTTFDIYRLGARRLAGK